MAPSNYWLLRLFGNMTKLDPVVKAKKALREYATARRKLAHRRNSAGAGIRGADHFLASIPLAPGAIIAGYWPIWVEFDVMPLLRRLIAMGHRCALPLVDNNQRELIF